MEGDVGALNLTSLIVPGITIYPAMVEGDLVLSHESYAASSAVSDHSTTAGSSALSVVSSSSDTVASSSEAGSGGSSNSSNSSSNIEVDGDGEGSGVDRYGGNHSGVVWRVTALEQSVSGESAMDWTIFPSTGLLLPGRRCVWCDEVRRVLVGAVVSRPARRCRCPL